MAVLNENKEFLLNALDLDHLHFRSTDEADADAQVVDMVVPGKPAVFYHPEKVCFGRFGD